MSKKLIGGIIGLMVFSWFIGFAMGALGASLPDEPVAVAVPEPIPELIVPEPVASKLEPIIISLEKLLPTNDDIPSGWIISDDNMGVIIFGDDPPGLEETIREFYIGPLNETIAIEIFKFDSDANAEAYYNAEIDNAVSEECYVQNIAAILATVDCHANNIFFSVFSTDFGESTAEKFALEFTGIVARNLLLTIGL